jgi:hypothetical protein
VERSKINRYRLSDQQAPNEYVDVCVVKRKQQPRSDFAVYELELSLSPTCLVERGLFSRGDTAIWLEAAFYPSTRELRIKNVEARSIARGQAFAENTYAQLLELTPGCDCVVLYNIINRDLMAHAQEAKVVPGWIVAPKGPLLRGVPKLGFTHLVGYEQGSLSIRATRGASAA